MRRFTLFALLASFTPWATAQRITGASGNHPPNSCNPGNVNSSVVSTRVPGAHGFTPNPALFFPFGFFPDSMYPPRVPPSPQAEPSLDLRQVLSALNKAQEEPQPPVQPLLIELQGNRYVQIKVDDTPADSRVQDATATKYAPTSARIRSAGIKSQQSAAQDLSPAILAFRDGHTEQVRDYAIANGVMYARGNLYADGYWNKKIELSALDVPQTTQLNATRGVRFVLPTAPNEVITRP